MESSRSYIPALRYHSLTPLYDSIIHRLMPEDVLRNRLVLEADILPGMRVLDLGCGTGTLAILVKQSHLMSQVYGLDADTQVLEIARSKANQAQAKINLEQGMAYRLPFQDDWFDRVVTSLVLHHLTADEKKRAMNEVFRVLRPGGKFVILDYGVPHGNYSWLVAQVLRKAEYVAENIQGFLPRMLDDAGFMKVSEIESFRTILGSLSLYQAQKQIQA